MGPTRTPTTIPLGPTPPLPLTITRPQPISALCSATLDALSPWLGGGKGSGPKGSRELQSVLNSLHRLQQGLAQADNANIPLFEPGAETDVRLALTELREIAARARQSRARPRIRVDRRVKEREGGLSGDEKRRLDVVANRVNTLVQVASWKRRDVLPDGSELVSTSSAYKRRGRIALGRNRAIGGMGRRGRVMSNDVGMRVDSWNAEDRSTKAESLDRRDAISSSESDIPDRPWEFSLIESPITPLRTRDLLSVPDGHVVMAMWRNSRVSVKIIRRDRSRFFKEADYLFSIGQSPNIPSLLGGYWEEAVKVKGKGGRKEEDGNVGYLITEVTNGVSLDKIVRDGKLKDIVSQIRILDRVVAALIFSQRQNPVITHQDLHPGNILLVPVTSQRMTSPDVSAVLSDTNHLHPSSDSSATTENSMPVVSQSTFGEISTGAEAEFSIRTDGSEVDKRHGSTTLSSPGGIAHGTTIPKGMVRDRSGGEQRPQIPKVDEVTEALARLQGTQQENRSEAGDVGNNSDRKTSLPAGDINSRLRGKSRIRMPAASPFASSSVTRTAETTASASVASMDILVANPRNNQSSLPVVSNSSISSFVVKVMDFADADEVEGKRRKSSWEKNDHLSGYCAPEKATPQMWRKMQERRDKEREREFARERGLITRATPSGRSSPRPKSRRRSNNGATTGYGGATARPGDTNAHRRQFDSETYALFGDDNLVSLPEADEFSLGIDEPASPPDRSGRHAVARGPGARPEPRERPRHNYADVANRLYTGQAGGEDDPRPLRPSTSDVSEITKEDVKLRTSKIDVWSIGWLLYYMCTSKHPPRDSWARHSGLTPRELADVPEDCRGIIRMCVELNVEQRASIRDVKRHIDSILQSLMFAKGLALLDSERDAAFVLLDKAVGIKSSRTRGNAAVRAASAMGMPTTDGEPGTTISNAAATSLEDSVVSEASGQYTALGLNPKTQKALSALPLVVVRRVEWEAAARYLRRSNAEIGRLRSALVNEKWNKSDVRSGRSAAEYLQKRSEEGVASAQSALGWVYRWGAGGWKKDVREALNQWEMAAKHGDPEACNGLGLLYHHGREDIPVNGEHAKRYYQIAVDQGYPAAAVNLGVMLHDGAAGVAPDGVAARGLYEMASRHGDAIAANNLGLLLQHGAPGVERDAAGAVKAYETAIYRNERHHACRNLAELLWDGADGVLRQRANAVEYFAHAIARGDASSRAVACMKLRKVLRGCEAEGADIMPQVLMERCHRLLAAFVR